MVRSFNFYFAVVVAGTLLGAILAGLAGLFMGMLLAQDYVRHSPSDVGDSPAYVTMGLVMLGLIAGALMGFLLSFTICLRSFRKRTLDGAELWPPTGPINLSEHDR